jgi:hypothetical protein
MFPFKPPSTCRHRGTQGNEGAIMKHRILSTCVIPKCSGVFGKTEQRSGLNHRRAPGISAVRRRLEYNKAAEGLTQTPHKRRECGSTFSNTIRYTAGAGSTKPHSAPKRQVSRRHLAED